MESTLRVSADGSVTILVLGGRFDVSSAPSVAERLAQAVESARPRIVVNLAEVEFLDSTALAILVQSMKRSRQHKGDVRLCCLRQPVRMIFELTRLDRAFEILASEDEAVRAFADADAS
jgi:anti-sigma B factor antagonist